MGTLLTKVEIPFLVWNARCRRLGGSVPAKAAQPRPRPLKGAQRNSLFSSLLPEHTEQEENVCKKRLSLPLPVPSKSPCRKAPFLASLDVLRTVLRRISGRREISLTSEWLKAFGEQWSRTLDYEQNAWDCGLWEQVRNFSGV